jgi:hypothetical protein
VRPQGDSSQGLFWWNNLLNKLLKSFCVPRNTFAIAAVWDLLPSISLQSWQAEFYPSAWTSEGESNSPEHRVDGATDSRPPWELRGEQDSETQCTVLFGHPSVNSWDSKVASLRTHQHSAQTQGERGGHSNISPGTEVSSGKACRPYFLPSFQ